MDNYQNDPAMEGTLELSRNMDIGAFATLASAEETDNYNTDNHDEEVVVEEIFEDFGAQPELPPELPYWIQQHQQHINTLQQATSNSQAQNRQGLTNLSGRAYHLEKLDHKHRMGDVLQALYPEWEHSSDAAQGKGFFEWLDGLSYFDVFARLKAIKGPDFARTNTPSFMKGVEYLDRLSRRHYQVVLSARQNCMLWNGRPLSTSGLQTVFSGKGWGAWVLSGSDKFYTGPHIRGQFHHSSFLSGGLVKAAGEWKVEGGRLQYITGKTGHYKCPLDKLVEALRTLQQRIGLKDANVIVWDSVTRKPTEFPAIVFLSNPAMQQQYEAIGAGTLHTPVRDQPRMQIGAHRNQP